ncbi:MAG TPA: tetratricopeptide repeat protein [Solimonas sp.]|nr:tetratricopeptide repeat protein [Solimonas sp.]
MFQISSNRQHELFETVLEPSRGRCWLTAGFVAMLLGSAMATGSLPLGKQHGAMAARESICQSGCGNSEPAAPRPAPQSGGDGPVVAEDPLAVVAEEQARTALLLQYEGQYAEAELLLRKSLVQRRQLFGESSPEVAGTLARLGLLLEDHERFTEAEAASRQALQLWQGLQEPEPTVTQLLQLQFARIHCLRVHGAGSRHCALSV